MIHDWADIALRAEPQIRLGVFLSVVGLMALWEFVLPYRIGANRPLRWSNHFLLLALGSGVARLLPFSLVFFAGFWEFGLFPWVALPTWAELILAIILMDLAIYGQHRLMHRVPVLWRLHRVHHADVFFDVTTALRFHPLEILVSLLYKGVIIGLLGPSSLAVLIFEILLNAGALFSHSNVHLPKKIDVLMRWVIVTPNMHRIHHSEVRSECDSNYGFFLSCWDRIFGSYTPEAATDDQIMPLGIGLFQTRRENWLDRLMTQPFRRS